MFFLKNKPLLKSRILFRAHVLILDALVIFKTFRKNATNNENGNENSWA